MKKIFCFIGIIILINGTPLFAEKSNEIQFDPNPFAIMGPPYSHMSKSPTALEEGEALLQLLELSGARWTRNDFWWGVVEPEPGRWEFDYFDQAIDSYQRHKIHLLLILCYGSAWNGEAPATEEEMQKFGEYVYQMVNRYQYWVKHWEIWNEPNILPFWAPKPNVEHYTRLLQIAYKRAKEADPDSVILAGAMAGADEKFLRNMYQNGAKGYFDVLSYHTYGNQPTEESQKDEIRRLKAIMNDFDDDKPLWLTETGIYTGPAGVSEKVQAERIIKSEIRWVSLGVQKIIQLALKDWTDDFNTRDATSFRGFTHKNGQPKPAFYAHRTLCRLLGDKPFLGHPKLHPEISAYLFGNPKQNILSLWTEEDCKVPLSLDLGVKSLVQTDLYGKETLLLSENGLYEIEIDQSPIFMEGIQDRMVLASQIDIRTKTGAIAIGDTGQQVLSVRNPFDEKIKIQPRFIDTPDLVFKEKGKSQDIDPGQTGLFTIPVQASKNAVPGEKGFEYRIENQRTGSLSLFGTVTLESPLSIQFKPYNRIAIPEGTLELQLTNRSTQASRASIHFTYPEGVEAPPVLDLNLKPNEQKTVPLKLNLNQLESGKEYLFGATLVKEHLKISTDTTLRLLKALKIDHPIQIDGNLDEWQNYPCNITPEMLKEIDFNPNLTLGKDDISAEGWLAWDEEALYLALKVHDDHLSLPHSTVVWDFDSLQVAIDGENDALPGEPFDKNDFEFEIALLENGHIMIYATQYPEGYIDSVVEQECEVAIVKDDNAGRMIYEIRIPKAIIPPIELEEGRVLGFSFILNDNDGSHNSDREGWLELTPGIGYGKDPSKYYDAILWP